MSEGELIPADGEEQPSFGRTLFGALFAVGQHEQDRCDRALEDERQQLLREDRQGEHDETIRRIQELLELSEEEGNALVGQAIARTNFETLASLVASMSNLAADSGCIQEAHKVENPTAFRLTAIDERTGQNLSFVVHKRIPEE